MAQHVKILGALHIALAAFGILAAVIVFVVLGGISGLIHMGGIDAGSDAELAAPVIAFKDVQKVLEQRCYQCHGAALQMKNVRLDSPELVAQHAQNVYQQVVVTKIMPMNNSTGITDAERDLIGKWFNAGAKTN